VRLQKPPRPIKARQRKLYELPYVIAAAIVDHLRLKNVEHFSPSYDGRASRAHFHIPMPNNLIRIERVAIFYP
jgi:hypothetical protein